MMKGDILDKKVLEKYVNLEKSYPSHTEKKEVMDILYKCNDALA